MLALQCNTALLADGFKEFPKYAHEVYHANDLTIPGDQLLSNVFFEQGVDGLVHFIVFV